MDKFGIFNLLNSFFSMSGQKSSQNNESCSCSTPNTNPLDKILSSITQTTQPSQKKPQEQKKSFAPLQASMLSTMHSHEQFVKRVKEKNNL